MKLALKSMPEALSAVLRVDPAHRAAEHARGVEQALAVPDRQALFVLAGVDLLDLQLLAHRLRDRQVARRQQHHEALTGLLVDHHLAKAGDVIEAGVGARVRQEHEARFEPDADAIGHSLLSL
jgi:hypothetical protein